MKLAVPFNEGFEERVTNAFKAFAAEVGLDKINYRALYIALMELALNAYEHSDAPDRQVWLVFEARGEQITLRVIDRGKGWKKRKRPSSPFRGHGLQMARAMVDHLIIEESHPGLAITISKSIRRQW